jgi:hypothetical protein
MACLDGVGDCVGGTTAVDDDVTHDDAEPHLGSHATTDVLIVVPESSHLLEEDAGGVDDPDDLKTWSKATDEAHDRNIDASLDAYCDRMYGLSRQLSRQEDEETGTLSSLTREPELTTKVQEDENKDDTQMQKGGASQAQTGGASQAHKSEASQTKKDDDVPSPESAQHVETEDVEEEDAEDIGSDGGSDGDGGAAVVLPNVQEAITNQILHLSKIGVLITHVKWCVCPFGW